MGIVLELAALALALQVNVAGASPDPCGGVSIGAGTEMFARLDEIASANAVVGYVIGIVSEGRFVSAHAFGERELGTGQCLDTSSILHWASVSKPFVATAIMQLHERGMLDLDSPMVEILPDYRTPDARLRRITIRQLLLHTSGLPDVEDYQWDRPQYDDGALSRWVLEESPRVLLFDPGSAREYSNTGYDILGLVIQRVSGTSFEKYMERNIFAPLGMTETTFVYPDVPDRLRTVGHSGTGNRVPVEHYPYNRRHAPSSTLNTNVTDMGRFVSALLNGGQLGETRILDARTVDEMWTPRWTVRDRPLKAAAMGWVVEDHDGRRMIRHFGWDDGFRSALIVFPDERSAVFLVTNDETAPMGELLRAALGEQATVVGKTSAGP